MPTSVPDSFFSQKKDLHPSCLKKEELTRPVLTRYTLSARAKSCNIKKFTITIICGAGVDYQKYVFWGAGHVVLQKLRVQVDLCL